MWGRWAAGVGLVGALLLGVWLISGWELQQECDCGTQIAILSAVSATASPVPTATRPPRPDLAPPATRVGVMRATLPFMADVPAARVGHFEAAQLKIGREAFAQWCTTCHGVQGQGLEASRHLWTEDERNCAQSGCHGRNHPPDGFLMIKVAPPLLGPEALANFTNAVSLFYYMRATMPYQAPGTLSDEEYWAITAYIADQRAGTAGGLRLEDANAANVTLHAVQ